MNRHRLDNLSWAMSEVYGATTDRILINLAKYFKYWKPGQQIPGSMQYQVRMLAQMGQVTRETVDIIAQSLGGADATLRQAIEATILDALKDDEKKLQHAAQKGLVSGVEGPITPNQMQAFTMYYKQSADGLNLVNTTMLRSTQAAYAATVADVSQRIQQIQSALNVGAGEVITGVSTWNEAMHSAVQKMVKTGITGFFDRAGHHWKPETYAAMNIRTTLANTSRKAVWERNEQYGNDLYQVSYHNGARPLCYPWQTKVLSTSGRTGKTTDYDGNEVVIHSESEVESFRYGGGLFGINCGHYPMVFIPGISSVREVKQTEEENAKAYKESQHQRALERKLREEKRDLEVLKAQGADEDQIKAQQAKVRKASHDIEEFCDATGRPRDRIREYTPIDAKWPDIPNVPPVVPPVTPPITPPVVPPVTPPAVTPVVPTTPKAASTFVTQELPQSGIERVPVKKFTKQPTMEEMIARIGGGDKTQGSCASLAWTWAGERAGYDVLDFRDGISRRTFSVRLNSFKVSKFPGVISWTETSGNDVKAATALLKHVEKGKEYALMTGCHASIVRLTDEGYQYLELQSPYKNGWFTLDPATTFKWRFGCKRSHTVYGMKVERDNLLVQIDSLKDSPDFAEMLEYINTAADKQRKGVAGGIK